jgi:anti-sigma regulatory factor (Ser/Thr protein kinase)
MLFRKKEKFFRLQVPRLDETSSSIRSWNIFVEKIVPAFDNPQAVLLDFCNCGFISAEGIALLAGLKFFRDEKSYLTTIDIESIKPGVKTILERCYFISYFGFPGSSTDFTYRATSTLPIHNQKKLDKDRIVDYIDQEILQRSEMPAMSELLQKEIRKAFFELFGNIFAHSSSSIGGLVCGQVFPKDKIIQIVFYDAGVGIASRVCGYNPDINSDVAAIEWALKEGNSTLSSEHISRGLGLFLIRRFIEVNEGIFRICANRGAVMESKKGREQKILTHPIKGTIIDMRIRIRDDVKYTLFSKDEI